MIFNVSAGGVNKADKIKCTNQFGEQSNVQAELDTINDSLENLNANFSNAHSALVEALAYSGLGITEDMTFAEISAILAETYPKYTFFNFLNTSTSTWVESGTGRTGSFSITGSKWSHKLYNVSEGNYGLKYITYNGYIDRPVDCSLYVAGTFVVDRSFTDSYVELQYSADNTNWNSIRLATGVNAENSTTTFSFDKTISIPSSYSRLYIRIYSACRQWFQRLHLYKFQCNLCVTM